MEPPNQRTYARRSGGDTRPRSYKLNSALAPRTMPSVTAVMVNSAKAPTKNGRIPCFLISRKSVFKPNPAKVSKKAQRERLAIEVTCAGRKAWNVAKSEMTRNPITNLGNFCQRNFALLVTRWAWPFDAQ